MLTFLPIALPTHLRCLVTHRLAALFLLAALPAVALAAEKPKPAKATTKAAKVEIGKPAPAFKIKDQSGKEIDLA